jgi:hypothetical protein
MEMMVIDRSDANVAMRELRRHYVSCQTYAKQHGGPCFLINLVVLPDAKDDRPEAEKVT